jgi:hypothetical protein
MENQPLSEIRFATLAKIFALGSLGCAAITFLLVFASGAIFPRYIGDAFDMSVSTFWQISLVYLGCVLFITAPLMLLGAWVLLRLGRLRSHHAEGDAKV